MTQFCALIADKSLCRIKTVVRPFGITPSNVCGTRKNQSFVNFLKLVGILFSKFLLTVNGKSIKTVLLHNFQSHSITAFFWKQLPEQELLKPLSYYFERPGNEVVHFSLEQKRATSWYWWLWGGWFQTNLLQNKDEVRVSLDYKEANNSFSL